jgi:hypothetical protein
MSDYDGSTLTVRKDIASEKKSPNVQACNRVNADHRGAKPRDIG